MANQIINKLLDGNSIENLQKQSTDIVSIFTKTVEDLKTVNTHVETQEKQRIEQKAKIDAELAALSTIKVDNEKVISKISKIFE